MLTCTVSSTSAAITAHTHTHNLTEHMPHSPAKSVTLVLDTDIVDVQQHDAEDPDVQQLTIREFPKYYPQVLARTASETGAAETGAPGVGTPAAAKGDVSGSAGTALKEASQAAQAGGACSLAGLFANPPLSTGTSSASAAANTSDQSRTSTTAASGSPQTAFVAPPQAQVNCDAPIRSCLASSVGPMSFNRHPTIKDFASGDETTRGRSGEQTPAANIVSIGNVAFVDPPTSASASNSNANAITSKGHLNNGSSSRASSLSSLGSSSIQSDGNYYDYDDEDDDDEDVCGETDGQAAKTASTSGQNSAKSKGATVANGGIYTPQGVVPEEKIKELIIESLTEIAQDKSTANLVINNYQQDDAPKVPCSRATNGTTSGSGVSEAACVPGQAGAPINAKCAAAGMPQTPSKDVVWVFSPAFSVTGKKGRLFDRLLKAAKIVPENGINQPLNSEIVISSCKNKTTTGVSGGPATADGNTEQTTAGSPDGSTAFTSRRASISQGPSAAVTRSGSTNNLNENTRASTSNIPTSNGSNAANGTNASASSQNGPSAATSVNSVNGASTTPEPSTANNATTTSAAAATEDVNVIKLIHYPGSSLCDHTVPKKEGADNKKEGQRESQREGSSSSGAAQIFSRFFNRHNDSDSDHEESDGNSTRPTTAGSPNGNDEEEQETTIKSIFKPLKRSKTDKGLGQSNSKNCIDDSKDTHGANTASTATSTAAQNTHPGNNVDISGANGTAATAIGEKIKVKYSKSQQTLGKGATAVVKLSQHEDELYAVKEFRVRGKGEGTKAYVKRVIAEFCISSSMHHANIVKTVDLVRDNRGHWCEIMEYMPGGTLFDLISGRGLSQQEASNLFRQLICGVEYIQSLGVAHRDLKPENLLLDADLKTLKITDFGVAEVYKTPFEKKEKIVSGVCGSEPYIPPEEWVGPYAPSRVDIWSCGIILHAMLLQTVPWRTSKSNDDHYQGYLHSNAPFVKIRNKEVRRLLCTMLQPYPEHRSSTTDILKSSWLKDPTVQVTQPGQQPEAQIYTATNGTRSTSSFDKTPKSQQTQQSQPQIQKPVHQAIKQPQPVASHQ